MRPWRGAVWLSVEIKSSVTREQEVPGTGAKGASPSAVRRQQVTGGTSTGGNAVCVFRSTAGPWGHSGPSRALSEGAERWCRAGQPRSLPPRCSHRWGNGFHGEISPTSKPPKLSWWKPKAELAPASRATASSRAQPMEGEIHPWVWRPQGFLALPGPAKQSGASPREGQGHSTALPSVPPAHPLNKEGRLLLPTTSIS